MDLSVFFMLILVFSWDFVDSKKNRKKSSLEIKLWYQEVLVCVKAHERGMRRCVDCLAKIMHIHNNMHNVTYGVINGPCFQR